MSPELLRITLLMKQTLNPLPPPLPSRPMFLTNALGVPAVGRWPPMSTSTFSIQKVPGSLSVRCLACPREAAPLVNIARRV